MNLSSLSCSKRIKAPVMDPFVDYERIAPQAGPALSPHPFPHPPRNCQSLTAFPMTLNLHGSPVASQFGCPNPKLIEYVLPSRSTCSKKYTPFSLSLLSLKLTKTNSMFLILGIQAD